MFMSTTSTVVGPTTPPGIRRGEPAYRRAVLAVLAAGLATFNALYCTQAMLPTLVSDLGVNPTEAALTVSAATGTLALFIVPFSILSERFGRGKILVISALSATVVSLILPLAPSIGWLIALRALQGALIAGVPAVAMTWLSEELDPDALPKAMGIYVAGTSVGGLTGRLIPAAALEIADWRVALWATGGFAVLVGIAMAFLLPAQRRFKPKQIHVRGELSAMVNHWRNPRLATLFITAFLSMGCFVSLYNFLGFRMVHTFGLSEALVGLVFLMYLAGTWSSAQAGVLTSRTGNGLGMIIFALTMLLGLGIMCIPNLVMVLIGLFAFTAAFFGIHSTASSWVGLIATENRAEGSSMYLFCYYVGSSVVGAAAGLVFASLSWAGFIGCLALIVLLILGIAVYLAKRERSVAHQQVSMPEAEKLKARVH